MTNLHLPDFILHHLPWDESTHSFWPISSFTLRRNLSNRLFSFKLSDIESYQIFSLLKSILLKTKMFKDAHVIELKALTKEEKLYLFEHFFISDDQCGQSLHQAIIIDKTCQIIAGINFGDHLIIHAIDSQNHWHRTIELIYALEKELSQQLEFAYQPRFGYLTQKPSQCGIALTIKAYLHLPATLQSKDTKNSLLELENSDEFLKISQMKALEEDNEPLTFFGDLVILENRYNLGISEDQILRSVYAIANKLINQESFLRAEIKRKEDGEFKDLISRSFGILKHSYQMPTKDALSALSYIKLGIDLGWITGISDDIINKIYFKSRKSHLLSNENSDLAQDALLHKRASFIHDELKNARLIF